MAGVGGVSGDEARVALRPVARSDMDDLIRANVESRAYHAPWSAPFTDAAGFEDWLAETASGASCGLVARERASGAVVGVVTLSQIVRKDFQNAYVGYYGSVAFARRGLMTEAVRLAAAFAFRDLGLHRLEANIQPGNLASLGLARRAGFRKEGFSPRYLRIGGAWRDHERWALLADEAAGWVEAG